MSSPKTVIHWSYGDINLVIQVSEVYSPEACESLMHRARREFVAGVRQLVDDTVAAQEPTA